MLKQEDKSSLMIRVVNAVIGFFEKIYDYALRAVAKAKIITIAAFIAICILTVWGWMHLPSEYEPEEDRAVIMLRMQAPEGTNYYTMSGYANQTTDVVFPLLEQGLAKNLMVVLTLCNPMDCSLPGFSLHGVLQARILECAVMTSSGVSS